MARSLFYILLLASMLLVSCEGKPIKVLMFGNSYTAGLTAWIKFLLNSRNDTKGSTMTELTSGGKTIGYHAGRAVLSGSNHGKNIAKGDWDFLVLQDQSQVPSCTCFGSQYRDSLAGVDKIHDLLPNNRTKLLLYLTWGRRNNDNNAGFNQCFGEMMKNLQAGYERYRDSVTGGQAYIAPVGLSFKKVHDGYCHSSKTDPNHEKCEGGNGSPTTGCVNATNQKTNFTNLYSGDGSHSGSEGKYLISCVFYAVMTGNSPVGLPTYKNIALNKVAFLQRIAHETVFLENPYTYPWMGTTTTMTSQTITTTKTQTTTTKTATTSTQTTITTTTRTSVTKTATSLTNTESSLSTVTRTTQTSTLLTNTITTSTATTKTTTSLIRTETSASKASSLSSSRFDTVTYTTHTTVTDTTLTTITTNLDESKPSHKQSPTTTASNYVSVDSSKTDSSTALALSTTPLRMNTTSGSQHESQDISSSEHSSEIPSLETTSSTISNNGDSESSFTNKDDDKGSTSTGVIAGVVVGALCFLILLVVVILFLRSKNDEKNNITGTSYRNPAYEFHQPPLVIQNNRKDMESMVFQTMPKTTSEMPPTAPPSYTETADATTILSTPSPEPANRVSIHLEEIDELEI
eukprot:m.344777 g.344777  ORF g.344777 m.344777 type:complete len:630 (-) comp25107_c0_seq1:178-2067(-)